MPLFDDILKSFTSDQNLPKSLTVVLDSLLSGQDQPQTGTTPPTYSSQPQTPQHNKPDAGINGLRDLLDKFRTAGEDDTVQSWVGSGTNKSIAPDAVGTVLGQQTISSLAQQAGISEQELLQKLSMVLPDLVDKLTPDGRLPDMNTQRRAAQGWR